MLLHFSELHFPHLQSVMLTPPSRAGYIFNQAPCVKSSAFLLVTDRTVGHEVSWGTFFHGAFLDLPSLPEGGKVEGT